MPDSSLIKMTHCLLYMETEVVAVIGGHSSPSEPDNCFTVHLKSIMHSLLETSSSCLESAAAWNYWIT